MFSSEKKSVFSALVALLFITLLNSCSTKESPLKKYGTELESVMKNEFGTFRGLNLGAKIDSVLLKEQAKPSESDENYLYYEFKLADSNSYNISYNFDEKGLNEIQSDIYIKNPANTENVFNSFKKYFDDHFGKNETHQGFTVWSAKSDTFGTVRINLSDDSDDLTIPGSPGKISLWIYPDNE